MTNRDLLKEAIADAKAVKETAIANAKAALEEVFTPRMKEMFAAKLSEMDENYDLEEADEDIMENELMDEELDEIELEEYGDEHSMSTKDALEKESMDEIDLDELLKELDEMDENINLTDFPDGDGEHGNIAGDLDEIDLDELLAEAEGDENEESMSLEDMTEEDLKSFIEDVIADMVEAGELEAGEESEGEDMEMDDEEEMEDEVDVEELMNEVKKEKEVEEAKSEVKKLKKEINEAYETIKTIKSELNEVNLFNAKLLYTNKIFKAKNLTENQKVKVLAAFDKATTVKEAKLVFESLSGGLKEKKTFVNESLLRGFASKPSGVAEKKPILEVNDQFARWQQLAGIKPTN